MINVRNLEKSYGKFEVLKDLNLELKSNRIIGLCGPNGSGKTTLIKTITGLLRNYKGEVLINGEAPSYKSKQLISYLPDLNYFNENYNAKQAKEYYKDMYADFNPDTFDDLLNKMHLSDDIKLRKMSKGMKEKFQLALCLSREAEIYILDEPIAGVDPASRDLIMETILNTYREDSLLIIATHLISDIETVLDEVIFINEGQITLHDNCDVLRERTGLSINELFREEFRWS